MSRKLLPEKKSLQIKKSEKTHKKKVCSLRHQLEFFFIGLLVVSMCTITAINFLFLERYYITKKTEVLEAAVNDLQKLKIVTDAEGNSTAEISDSLKRECSENNLTWTIITVDGKEVASEGGNEKMLQARLIGYAYDLDEQKGWTKILDSTDTYVIQQVSDRFVEMDYVESWGVLDNGCFFLIRTPLESIRDSVSISNSFYFFVGILIITVSAVILWAVTKRITNPISELTVLSTRMKNLDFDAKYKCRAGNEIDELGENFNKMSEELEKTISELKSVNNQLQKDIENKIRIDQQRQEFLNNVSHELKTPIALVQGYAEGLKENISDDPESREFYCDVIMDEAAKMNKLVKNLLTLNHLEEGRDEVKMERFDIVSLIKGILQSMDIMIQQKEAKVSFEAEEPVYVWADEFKTEEVVINFVSNAINHVDFDKVIEIKMKKENGKVHTSVFNTGVPIPEADIDKIWIKFYKVDKARTREYGGSGIGLSIVKAIMDSMHQKFGVKNYDNGVEFWFELEADNGREMKSEMTEEFAKPVEVKGEKTEQNEP